LELIRVRGVSYQYTGNIKALAQVNLSVWPGEFLAVLGRNGSGKTTLFKLLTGILTAQTGEIFLNDKPVSGISGKELHARVGFVFQDPNDQLFAPTVAQDVAFGPANLGLSREEIACRVKRNLAVVGLAGFEDRPTHQLSFGQKKRVAVAGVLAMEPEVLILDEPTAGLDPLAVSDLMKMMLRLNQERGLTVIFSTHDVELVPVYAHRVCVLDRGEPVLEGSPETVFNRRDVLRRAGLRLPRMGHFFEVLEKHHGWKFNEDLPLTIGQAWRTLLFANDKGKKRCWRKGYTTGSCAAAAAKGAAAMLNDRKLLDRVSIPTPAGAVLNLELHDRNINHDSASCSVVKDAGDDPDITDGIKVFARVSWTGREGVEIAAGEGIGRVTRPGLAVAVGAPAINPVPRQMIEQAVSALLPPGKGALVKVWVPGGEKLAEKTLNPQLGIKGGISILGTTGIVEPMSEEAFKSSLVPQIRVALAQGEDTLVLTPGRLGRKHARALGIPETATVQMSNFVGYMLEQCVARGVKKTILCGHLGKLAKVAAGIFHTHSKVADARLEALITEAALAGVDRETIMQLSRCVTAEAAIPLLAEKKLQFLFHRLAEKAAARSAQRVQGQLKVGAILFSLKGEVIGYEPQALEMGREKNWFARLQ